MDTISVKLSASPDEYRSRFYSLKTPQDVAYLLEIDLKRLYYHIYVASPSLRYATFEIPKRSGTAVRTICAPVTALKILQKKLNQILLQVYALKPPVHSFVLERSIVSNARIHLRRRTVLNIDLQDFFPSVNFGRVRGMFMGTPYKLNPTVATILAQICCFNNQLPQGAPTSPIITNMICAKMDSQLMALAKANKCDYTRYADDITFSTNLQYFPTALATIDDLGQTVAGAELERIITQNGFRINQEKVRLRGKNQRQQVTGVTVNQFLNVRRRLVRQIRAMLHAWEKYGLQGAQEEFSKRYNQVKYRGQWKGIPPFKQVVKGKIEFLGMVRGKNDLIYLGLCSQLKALAPEMVKAPPKRRRTKKAQQVKLVVLTEGKSDWKHLECAITKLKGLREYSRLDIEFMKFDKDMGDAELLKLCKSYAKVDQDKPTIFIFDKDNQARVDEVSDESTGYKSWGNNVFSFAIPIPNHRNDNPQISIEFYYKDEEIRRKDENGRRLFLSNEFDTTGRHKSEDVICHSVNKIRSSVISVIADGVLNRAGTNVALSKDDFAECVLSRKPGFDGFDFTEFRKIFDVISAIVGSQS